MAVPGRSFFYRSAFNYGKSVIMNFRSVEASFVIVCFLLRYCRNFILVFVTLFDLHRIFVEIEA